MDEAKIILSRPQTITAGRHRIKITPPTLEWWIGGIALVTGIYSRVKALEKMGDYSVLTIANVLKMPTIDILDHLALTTNKRPLIPFRFERLRLVRARRGEWFIQNMTPVELGIFIQEWLRVIDIEVIKDVFRQTGEKAGLKGVLAHKIAGSPAPSTGSPDQPGSPSTNP